MRPLLLSFCPRPFPSFILPHSFAHLLCSFVSPLMHIHIQHAVSLSLWIFLQYLSCILYLSFLSHHFVVAAAAATVVVSIRILCLSDYPQTQYLSKGDPEL